MGEHRDIKRLTKACVWNRWQGQKLGPLVSPPLSPQDPLWLNAVEGTVIVTNISELLEEDRSLSLWPGLFPGWLCRLSKTRVGRDGWGQFRETWFPVEKLCAHLVGVPFKCVWGSLWRNCKDCWRDSLLWGRFMAGIEWSVAVSSLRIVSGTEYSVGY